MARLTNEDRELILADYHTGDFSQRELAKKHKVSVGTVSKITKEEAVQNEHIMNAQVTVLRAEKELPTEQMNAIINAAQEKVKHVALINDNATLLAGKITTMAQQIDTPSDLKTLVDANDRLAITLKTADRHAPKIDITQQQAVQSTAPTTIQYIEDIQTRD